MRRNDGDLFLFSFVYRDSEDADSDPISILECWSEASSPSKESSRRHTRTSQNFRKAITVILSTRPSRLGKTKE